MPHCATFALPLLASCTLIACSGQPQEVHSAKATHLLKETSGIRGIFEDSKGVLYLTSPDWTARYEPHAVDAARQGFTYLKDRGAGVLLSGFQEDAPLRKGTFTNFGLEEGWPCQNVWTIYKTRNGELLFCGEDPGVAYRFNGEGFGRVY
ncbi:MAG: hypothetical protein ACPG31_05385 [Planctomycetota bacterium]